MKIDGDKKKESTFQPRSIIKSWLISAKGKFHGWTNRFLRRGVWNLSSKWKKFNKEYSLFARLIDLSFQRWANLVDRNEGLLIPVHASHFWNTSSTRLMISIGGRDECEILLNDANFLIGALNLSSINQFPSTRLLGTSIKLLQKLEYLLHFTFSFLFNN